MAASTSGSVASPGPASPWSALREFFGAIRADHATIRHYVLKYGSAEGETGALLWDLLRKIGLQIMAAYRVMQLFHHLRLPLLPMIVARLTRHLYGCDIHWKAEFAPGVMLVHGMGLCVSHGARVASGVILFQNVTLGQGIDPLTRAVGARTLEQDVHVGPGATLLGPIRIGRGSKIMAGCVVMCSIPPMSLVEAPTPQVRSRLPSQTHDEDGAAPPDTDGHA